MNRSPQVSTRTSMLCFLVGTCLGAPAIAQTSFTFVQYFDLGGIRPRDSAVTDFNEDGALDVIVGEGLSFDQVEGDIAILVGDGTGVFPDGENSGIAVIDQIDLGDLNNDGHQDIVFTSDPGASIAPGFIGVVLGTGTGSLPGLPDWTVTIPDPLDVGTGDFDEDGDLDLIVTSYTGNHGFFYHGNGDGTFAQPVALPDSLGGDAYQLSIGDINNDGHLDALIGGIGAYLGDGLGGFTKAGNGIDGTLADMDMDGTHDLIYTTSTMAVIYKGQGNGNFAPILSSVNLPLDASHSPPPRHVVGDFNGDGIPDLATLNGDFVQSGAVILLNDGTGGLTVDTVVNIGNDAATDLTALDANWDGLDDLVIHQWSPNGSSSWVYQNTTTPPMACQPDLNGDGVLNFFDVSAFLAAFSAGDASADFNPDGLFNFFDVSAFLSAFAQGCP